LLNYQASSGKSPDFYDAETLPSVI